MGPENTFEIQQPEMSDLCSETMVGNREIAQLDPRRNVPLEVAALKVF